MRKHCVACFPGIAIGGAMSLAAILLAAAPLAAQGPPGKPSIDRATTTEPSGARAALALQDLLVDAIARGEKSVVAIYRVDGDEAPRADSLEISRSSGRLARATASPGDSDFIPDEYGTGVVIDRHGLILTCYHVLGLKSQHYVTTYERKVYPARIKAADPRSDLAVLEIKADDLVPIKLGNADTLKKGQIVVALGNPFAIARDGQASASWGIIANLARKAGPAFDSGNRPLKDKLYHFGTLIQTDAKLNFGTSGGALVNLKGEMIGLTTALAATAGYEQAAGYAIPVDATFRRAVDTLKDGREVEYGYLGVKPVNLNPAEILGGAHGARIMQVEPGSPAEESNLKLGDVVTQVNGRAIFDADELYRDVGSLPAESHVELMVLRDEQTTKIPVVLAKYPVRGVKVVTKPGPSWRGMRIDFGTALPRDLGRIDLGIPDPGSAVVVVEVEKGSPAAAAGLQYGMFIGAVGTTSVRTPREFFRAVAGKTGDVSLRMATTALGQPDIRTVKPPAQ
ncbi:MAG TPA: trypsin-like peptidase domain-containing protein [Pirellulales bacterium]|jgi:S1-C subfamily serine protease|nr:trypsin-like peptidase domain-containing protein [Pirellulales bacterium]